MAGKKIGVVLALDGEKQFVQGVANAKKESALLQSELKKLSAEYEGNANSLDFLQKKQENLGKQTESYTKRLEESKKGLENAQNVQKKAITRYQELTKELEKAENAQKAMKDSGTASEKEMQNQAKEIENLQKALDKQGTEVQKCEGKISDWSKKVADAETDLAKNNRAIQENEKYLKEAQEATDGYAKSIDSMGDAAEGATETVTGWSEKLGTAIVTTGVGLATDAIGAIAGKAKEAAEYAIEVGSSFEAGMSEVAAISGATGSQLDALSKKAKALGSSTKFSATEAASAMTNMSLAGWTVEQTLSGIDGVMQLAAASGMDLADASQIVTDNISSFNLQASDAVNLADMMAYAQANSSTTAAELGEAYKNCAANMNAAGQDIETTTSMLESLANNGLRGSEAGTAMAATMRDMTAKMKDGAITIGETSVRVMDSNGNFRDMTDILKDVEKATDGMGDAQKQQALATTFTSDSIKGLNMLLNTGADQISGYEDNLRNCAGAAQDMADTMQDNLKGKVTELGSALEGLGIAAYEKVSAPLTGAVEGLTGIVSGLTSAIDPAKDDLEQFIADTIEYRESLENTLASANQSISDANDNAAKVQILGDQLIQLNSVEELSETQKYRLKSIVDELGKSIPELAEAYDEETGKVNLSTQAIKDLIDNTKQLMVTNAMQQAMQEEYNALLESTVALEKAKMTMETLQSESDFWDDLNQTLMQMNETYSQSEIGAQGVADFYDGLASVQEKLKAAFDAGTISADEYNEAMASLGENGSGWQQTMELAGQKTSYYVTQAGKATDETNKLQKSVDDCNESISNTEDAMKKSVEAITGESDAYDENSSQADKNAQKQEQLAQKRSESANAAEDNTLATQDETKALEEQEKASEAAANAQKNALQDVRDEYTSTVDSIKSSLQDKINPFEIFDTSDKGEDVTVEKMTENLNSQIEAFQNYQQNLEAVKDHVGKEISPEFMQYLENMGMEGANTLEHILITFRDNEPEKVKELNDKWMQAMDQTDNIAKVSAANQLALKMGLKEMSSTDADFSDLRASIDKAVSSAAKSWKSLPQATEDALNQAINTAQELGIQIPEGLAEGIASGETSPESAMEQIQAALEGRCEGLLEVANQAGIQVPDEIKTGIEAGGQKAVEAYNALIALLAEKEGDAEEAGKSAGEAQSSGYTAGVKDGQSDTEKASSDVAQAGADAAKEKDSEYESAGTDAAKSYASGISSGKSLATQEAAFMAGQARSAAATYENSFYTAGYNASSGFAEGIRQGKSKAINAAAQMAAEALKAAKDKIGIKSPSRKFRDEVGKQVGAGFGLGIKDSTEFAVSASASMSNQVYKKAASWLKNYRKDHTTTVAEEKWFWQQIQQQAKAGSSAYKKATAEITKLDSSSTITDALAKKINNNFGVSASKTTGSGKNKKSTPKAASEYRNDVIQAAEKTLNKYKTLHATTEDQEIAFWTAVRSNLQKGSKGYTQAYYDITEKIQDLNAKRQEAYEKDAEAEEKAAAEAVKTRASVQDKILSSYKTYFKMSAKAEVGYWDTARQQFQEGTDERIEADQKYFEAKEDYEEQKLELEKDYADKEVEIKKNLADKEKELQDNLTSTLQNRKKEILSSMSGFDAWDAEGYVADTMLYNLKTQVEGLKLWENQLAELGKKGLSADIMKELQEMGPEAAANIYTLNQMTAEQLDEFNKLWTEKNELADKQAREENQDLIKQTHDGLATLRKDTNDQLTKLKADYNTAIADLEQGLSDGLKGLVDQAGSIGEEMVAALVEKLQQAGSAAQTAGIQAGSQTGQAEEPMQEAIGNTQDLEAIEKAQVLTVIASGKTHNKAVSAAEKKKHSDLWAYIVKKYGKSVNIAATKQLADILGVEASAKPSTAQLKEILSVMKKKGYSSGTRRILEDQLAWLSEGGSQEYVLRKSDGAIMQNMLRGDKVINPAASENLYNFANNPDAFLSARAGIAKLNSLSASNPQQEVISVDNREVSAAINHLTDRMEDMTEQITNLQVLMDGDAVVGALAPKMSRELATQSTRTTRGAIK